MAGAPEPRRDGRRLRVRRSVGRACGGRADRRWCRSARSRSRSRRSAGSCWSRSTCRACSIGGCRPPRCRSTCTTPRREADRVALEQFLQAQPTVAAVEYVSQRARARALPRRTFPELRDVTTGVGENPFPSALEVRLRTGNGGDAAADEPVARGRRASPASATFATTAAGWRGWSAWSRPRGWLRRWSPAS